jgi:hypothetical protein
MIIRLIFIVTTLLLSNSLLASSNNATTSWESVSTDNGSNSIYTVSNPITIDGLLTHSSPSLSLRNTDSQTKSSKEYHTFKPENKPPIYIWTIFPGPKSNVTSPTVVKSLIGLNFNIIS